MNSEDLNFAYKVRHALNEKLDNLPASTADRLASARKIAVSRKKADSPLRVAQRAFAGTAGVFFSSHSTFLQRMGTAIPLLALVAGLSGIYQYEQQQRISELAELDAAVLSDELPLTAYQDEGFKAYISSEEKRSGQ